MFFRGGNCWKKLIDQNVLITGGSSGIGQAIAVAFAKEGANVAFSYNKNYAGAQNTLEKIQSFGQIGFAIDTDLSEIRSVFSLFEKTLRHLSTVDLLINNAGTLTRHASFLDISLDCFERIHTVNLKVPFILMQMVARHMINNHIKGSIINISSLSTEVITPGLAHYESSKSSLNALTRAAASDLAQYGIRVNAIAPGLVTTDINQEQREKDPEAWKLRNAIIPLGRTGDPQDIANMAVFLASSQAEWITGSIFIVDGGIKIISPFRKKQQ